MNDWNMYSKNDDAENKVHAVLRWALLCTPCPMACTHLYTACTPCGTLLQNYFA